MWTLTACDYAANESFSGMPSFFRPEDVREAPHVPPLRARQFSLHVLGIEEHQVHPASRHSVEVHDSRTTGFPASSETKAQFPQTTGARDDGTAARIAANGHLELTLFVLPERSFHAVQIARKMDEF